MSPKKPIVISKRFGMAMMNSHRPELRLTDEQVDTRLTEMTKKLHDLGCTHYYLKEKKENIVFFTPWIYDNPNVQKWFDVVREYSFLTAKSCECEPEGQLYVYSEDANGFVKSDK